MSIAAIVLGVWLILMGLSQLGVFAVSGTILGILALVAGLLYFIEAVRPFRLPARN